MSRIPDLFCQLFTVMQDDVGSVNTETVQSGWTLVDLN